jgi:hypothetical protein
VSELGDRCGSVLVSCSCHKLVAGERVQFENPEEGKRPSLEPVTRQRLRKRAGSEYLVRAVVNCRVYGLAIAL